ncbi:MAG: GtrA family protein [Lacisediminihabitans sp.]
MRSLFTQLVRFGLVGVVGLVIDVGVFNLLRVTVLTPEAVQHGPIYAKVISTSLAILANWLGNRYWTFGHVRRPHFLREGIEFVVVSLGGMVIGLACLWVSHYALGFTSLLADNVSTNVIGLVLGTAFRFWLYRVWVFRGQGGAAAEGSNPPAEKLRTSESPVKPAGLSPLRRVQTVAPIDDGLARNE